jgi:xanthine/uracil permease
MGIIAKFGAVFASMPPSVLGGMQVFLYSTIAVAGIRVLALIAWTRRDRFILAVALGVGFMDICQPDWFASILDYSGSNANLVGFEQGINLAVETPFVIAAIVGVFLNSVLPADKSRMGRIRGRKDEGYGDERRHPVIGVREE